MRIFFGVFTLLMFADIRPDVNDAELFREVTSLVAAQEILLDGFIEKVKKSKLKPVEYTLLFPNRGMSKKDQLEHLEGLREKVRDGEAACSLLRASKLDRYESGLIVDAIRVQQTLGKDAFLGRVESSDNRSEPMLFRMRLDVVDEDKFRLTQPVIITGRVTYDTALGGTKTVWLVETLSSCVKRMREAQAKKRN